jgi:hypothetical protein
VLAHLILKKLCELKAGDDKNGGKSWWNFWGWDGLFIFSGHETFVCTQPSWKVPPHSLPSEASKTKIIPRPRSVFPIGQEYETAEGLLYEASHLAMAGRVQKWHTCAIAIPYCSWDSGKPAYCSL